MASLVIKSIATSYWKIHFSFFIQKSFFKAGLQWCFDQSFLYSMFQVTKNNMRDERERGVYSLLFFGVFILMQAYVIVNIWLFYSTALFSWYIAVWEKGGWVTRGCSSFHEHSSHFQITQPFKIWDIMKNLNVDVSTYC